MNAQRERLLGIWLRLLKNVRDEGDWFVRGLGPLWHLLSRYPLIFLPVAGFFAIHWGLLLGGFDGVHVIWSDSPWTCVFTGMGIGIFLGGVMAATWWLDACRAEQAHPVEPQPTGVPYLAGWILLVLVALAPAVARSSLFEISETDSVEAAQIWSVFTYKFHRTRLCLPAGLALAMLIGLGCYHLAVRREIATRWLWRLGWWPPIVIASGYIVISLIHWVTPDFYLPFLAAPLTALLLLGFTISLAALAHRFSQSRHLGPVFYPIILSVVVLYQFWGGWIEPIYKVPGLDAYYANRRSLVEYEENHKWEQGGLGGPPTNPLVNDRAALEAWKARPGNADGPVIVLSVSGGASTSAVYVARSLFALEARFPGCSDRIRVICGASGGMLGAAYFVAQFRPGSPYRSDVRADGFEKYYAKDPAAAHAFRAAYEHYTQRLSGELASPDDLDRDTGRSKKEEAYWAGMREMEDQFAKGLEADFLSPIFQKWVHKDLNPISHFFPQETQNDRGTALELAWGRHLLGRPERLSSGEIPLGKVSWNPSLPSLGVPFAELREEERLGLIPSLIFTPMMVEDGRQLIISNLDLDYMIDWGTYTLPGDQWVPRPKSTTYSALEFYRLFPESAGTFQLGTAVRLNATFPVFTPATELPTNPPRRVVDAGYFDNFGTVVATRWIEKNRAFIEPDRDHVTENANVPVLVLQLWTYGYDARGQSLVSTEEKQMLEDCTHRLAIPNTGVRATTLPVGGLFAASDASMAYRGEERLNMLLYGMNQTAQSLGKGPVAERSRFDIGRQQIPMNWFLTDHTLARLKHSAQDFALACDILLAGREHVLRQNTSEPLSAATVSLTDIPLNYKQKLDRVGPTPELAAAAFREKVTLADKLYKVTVKSAEETKKQPRAKK